MSTFREREGSRWRTALAGAARERVGFAFGALTNVVTISTSYALLPYAQLSHLMLIHLAGAVLISTRYGMVVSSFTAIIGAAAFDWFCVPPVFAFAIPDPNDRFSMVGMLLVALWVCWLNQGVRSQRAAAKASEERTQALCQLSLDLSHVVNENQLATRAEQHLREMFGPHTRLVLGRAAPAAVAGLELVPINDEQHVVGHVQCEPREHRSSERQLLLDASADRIADALRLLQLGEAARRAEVDAEVERNRSALLSAVSHDMKTPLASIMAAGSVLLGRPSTESNAKNLLETIVEESQRMNRMIVNLLDVTRLESGKIVLERAAEALDELVQAALERFSGRLAQRQLTLDLPRDLPLVLVDAVLLDHVLTNLLENVVRYTPPHSPLEIRASAEEHWIRVDVVDHGPGIPADERHYVFEKFFRGHAARQKDGGTGLGLTICRAVVAAHGGGMEVTGVEPTGTRISFTLPVADMKAKELSAERSVSA